MLADFTHFFLEALVTDLIFPILAGLFGRAGSPLAAWFKGLAWFALILAGTGTGLACWWSPVGPLANWAAIVVVVAGFAAIGLGLAARITDQCALRVLPKPATSIARSGTGRAAGDACPH